MKRLRWVALLLGTSVAACSLAPHYTIPAVSVPASYHPGAPWTVATPDDDQPRGDWWTMFGDPRLDALEAQVDGGNPTLAAALAAYDQSRAYAAEADAALLPALDVAGSATGNRQSAERPLRGANEPNQYGDNTLAAGLDYEFDFWGKLRNRAAAGEAQAQASAADLATARLSLHAQLADTYFALRGTDDEIRILRNAADLYQRALDLVQARHSGGVASGLDLDRARTQLASAQAALSDMMASRALYVHAIASLIGIPAPSFTLPPLATAPAPVPMVPPGVPSTLLQRRPDIAAAERQAFAANRLVGVARAAYFPSITLDASAGFQNTGSVNLISLPYSTWTLGPQINWPIFEGGAIEAQVAASKAAFELASAQYRATVLTAFQQVADNLSLETDLARESAQQRQAVQSAEATQDLSLLRYQEGIVNYLDVVDAQSAALDAERGYAQLQTRRLQAAVNLARALGGGWSRDKLPGKV